MGKGSHLVALNLSRKKDLSGQKFGKLTVICEDGHIVERGWYTYKCMCDCGNERNNCIGYELKRGKIKSCGCSFPKNHCIPGKTEEEYFYHVKKSLLSLRNIQNECWEYTGILNNKGYGWKTFGQGKEKRKWVVHRISWTIWKEKIPEDLFVLHKCDNPKCFNPDHLWLGTQQDNMNDKVQKGRDVVRRGEKCGMAKLNNDQVLEIRKLREDGMKLMNIANKFDVTDACISDICKRKNWRHI